MRLKYRAFNILRIMSWYLVREPIFRLGRKLICNKLFYGGIFPKIATVACVIVMGAFLVTRVAAGEGRTAILLITAVPIFWVIVALFVRFPKSGHTVATGPAGQVGCQSWHLLMPVTGITAAARLTARVQQGQDLLLEADCNGVTHITLRSPVLAEECARKARFNELTANLVATGLSDWQVSDTTQEAREFSIFDSGLFYVFYGRWVKVTRKGWRLVSGELTIKKTPPAEGHLALR
jgi:hypothetical protein